MNHGDHSCIVILDLDSNGNLTVHIANPNGKIGRELVYGHSLPEDRTLVGLSEILKAEF